jgi:myo-inositol-1(or 4)-monophosphatase
MSRPSVVGGWWSVVGGWWSVVGGRPSLIQNHKGICVEHIDLEEVRSWAAEAGEIALGSFKRVDGRRKSDSTWVTEADEVVERMLVERIVARYPSHGIIGEEHIRRNLGSEFVWALDPIDGTASFVAGLPTWGVSIGLLRHGAPYAGVIYLPLLNDYYWATAGGGAFWNGTSIHVIDPLEWDSEDWLSVPSDSHRYFTIDFPGKIRALGSTIITFSYVARGGAVGGVLTRAELWDIAAGLVILDAAGGSAVTFSGVQLDISSMLDGRSLPEPVILSAPGQSARIRGTIRAQ